MNRSIARECASLDTVALVRVLTVDKPHHDSTYLACATRELETRGLNLENIINNVHMAQNDDEGQDATILQVLEQTDKEWPLWSLLTVKNSIGDAWVIQKEHSRWLVHFYEGDAYCFSFFYDTITSLKKTLKLFLELEAWEVTDSHELNNWKPIFHTRSPAFLTKVVADLDRENILHTVKTPLFTHDKKGTFILTVPRYHLKAGERIVAHAQQELAKLYDQAERLAEHHDKEQEFKVYDLLMQLVPDNPAVHYNRGQMWLEMGNTDKAVEALAEAIILGLPEIPEQIPLHAKRGGLSRMAGSANPLLSLVVLAQQSERPKDKPIEYPDYIEDCEMLLERILEQQTENIAARHCLATIAELKNEVETAKKHYRKILDLNPEDKAAKANLAYHRQDESEP